MINNKKILDLSKNKKGTPSPWTINDHYCFEMEDKDSISKAFVENMLSYAMARELNFLDREHIDQLYQQCANKGFRLRDILLEIVSSNFFTRR